MSAVLMYHYVDVPVRGERDQGLHHGLFVPPGEFASHLSTLQQTGRRTVTPAEYSAALQSPAPGHTVWITFDDGRLDNYEHAFPRLVEMGMTATFFVVSDWSLSGKEHYLNVAMMREMAAAGMTIGSHSATHTRLTRLTPEALRREVHDSRARLEDAIGTPVISFCYPYGNLNRDVIAAVRDAGYQLAVSTRRGNRNHQARRYHLHRVMVQPGRTGWRFRYLFSPLYHWIHERKNRSRWKGKGAEP